MQEHLPDRKMIYPPRRLSTDWHPFPSPSGYNFLLIPNFLRPVRKADSNRPHSPRILLSRKFPHFRAAAPQSSPTLQRWRDCADASIVHVHKRKGILHVLHRGKFIRRPSFRSLSAMQEKVWREQLVSENWREVFHLEAWISFPPLISSRLFFDLINGYPGGKSSVLRRSRLRTISWRRALREYGSWRGKWNSVPSLRSRC